MIMKLSVAYTFEPGLIEKLSEIPEVHEIYGKLNSDIFGGGRSSYTLRQVSRGKLEKAIRTAHACKIRFNYLINGATLGGLEQTRQGQRRIRKFLEYLDKSEIDAVTVASPYLLRLVKKKHPRLKVRAGVFAVIDSPLKAKQWEDMGADTLCLSSIACNRDFEKLERIRKTVSCGLQLIVNANCLSACAYELTHMDLLTRSSRKHDTLKGFCLDYCILHCSSERLRNPVNYIRSIWIRPEDLYVYESMGYTNFKIIERSCPGDLLLKRVKAYSMRKFDGNLLEIAGQVAQVKKEQNVPGSQYLRMIKTFFRPDLAKLSTMLALKKYGESIIIHRYGRENAPVYIDNRSLDGFLESIREKGCDMVSCNGCGRCDIWAEKAVFIDKVYRTQVLGMAETLERGLCTGELW